MEKQLERKVHYKVEYLTGKDGNIASEETFSRKEVNDWLEEGQSYAAAIKSIFNSWNNNLRPFDNKRIVTSIYKVEVKLIQRTLETKLE